MKNHAVCIDKEIERVTDESAKGGCWSSRSYLQASTVLVGCMKTR